MASNLRRQVRARGRNPQRVPSITRLLAMVAATAMVLAGCLLVRFYWGPSAARAQSRRPDGPRTAGPAAQASPSRASVPSSPQGPPRQIVANVNGEQITRNQLGSECLRHYGKDVLESLINKQLIAEHCQANNIAITQSEVSAEIERLARRFGLGVEQWLKMLEERRDISPQQYADDVVWPTLALRKLAATQLTVTREELAEAYEARYGEAVRARIIAANTMEAAREVRAQAIADPDDFGNLAKQHSVDVNSASANGIIPPIFRHVSDEKIEQVAFSLAKGEISEIVRIGTHFVFLKCEGRIPPRRIRPEDVRETLAEAIRDRKLKAAANDLFEGLRTDAAVENVFNDPAKRKQMPGVAAVINGRRITIAGLAKQCLHRHGTEVLEGVITHKLIEQALRRRNISLTRDDIDREIARAATAMGKTDANGNPDVKAWLDTVTQQNDISVDLYIHDAVRPSVALKKLVIDRVQVTDDDLRRGYEANYGPRVRVQAIVQSNLRRAQEVWDLARTNPTPEHFGDLAEQYSVEANTRALRGEVPPIQKWGGNPVLEKEAFKLNPGELSSIIQVADKYVILLCEGRTKPKPAEFEVVRDLLYEDIHEKKLRIAMAKELERIKESARIENFLAGTSQSPRSTTDEVRPAAAFEPRGPSGSPPPAAAASPRGAVGGR